MVNTGLVVKETEIGVLRGNGTIIGAALSKNAAPNIIVISFRIPPKGVNPSDLKEQVRN